MRASGMLKSAGLAVVWALAPEAGAQDSTLSFFITGSSMGQGGNLGGLAGADAHCQKLADSVGAGTGKVWRAYLSTQAVGGQPAVNARDRIGTGPWFNANKVKVASNVTELHGTNNLSKQTSVTHRGTVVTGRGDSPNLHDLMTGTKANGMAPAAGVDSTCANWTSSAGSPARTIVGHHDRMGISSNIDPQSWTEAHVTTGCSQTNVQAGGGAGYFYCFVESKVVGINPREASNQGREFGSFSDVAPYYLSSGQDGVRAEEVVYRFTLDRESRVEVTALDIRGRERAVLLRATRSAGDHEVRWNGMSANGEALPAGLYRILFKRDGMSF